MATGMVLSAAQTLFAALQCKEIREVCSKFRYESQLNELQRTVGTIKAVLLDAESKHQELTNEGRDWVESLKDAVYDVDDLLDEFRTVAQQQQQMRHAKVSKKVRRFFSRYNKVVVAFNTSHEIKKLRDKLDNIAMNRSKFGFGDTYEPVHRRAETCSYVREESIIGREEDREIVVHMLLSENIESISFVSVVGIGGLGKTALAQLVFNDDRIKSSFDLRLWVCVSEDFSVEGIFSKMVEKGGLTLEGLLGEVRQKIEGKKYLLVLDDVWNEKRDEWLVMRDFLCLGSKGSRVLVTTRSKQVAEVVENNSVHHIQGLSDHNSWTLFKKMAFKNGEEPEECELVEIGKEIVKKGANVPLAIRVIGSLLYGQDKNKWISFKSVDLSKMGEDKEGILPVLKYSYYHLSAPLKSCFSYCALFPKDYVIEKQFLINLWMAQGCLDDHGLQDNRSLEDAGEEIFSILLHRCFLQDIEKNKYDEIHSCKMHDLIHDLAQEVAGKEFSLNTIPNDRKVRHLSFVERSLILNAQKDSLDKMKNLRTALTSRLTSRRCHSYSSHMGVDVTKILPHARRLRVFQLHVEHMKTIPKTLSNLVHLRYLDLSRSMVVKLPKSITKLLNLKVMKLSGCSKLQELPKDLEKLVNLRQLDIEGCRSLTHMPAGLNNLTCLQILTMFVLGRGSSNQVQMGRLQDLKHLHQLRDGLKIVVSEGYSYNATNAEGGYLLNKSHIKTLTIENKDYWKAEAIITIDEGLLEVLEPHCNVRSIDIRGYRDMKLPNWVATLGSSFPLLVSLCLVAFPMLRHLPPLLSQLQHLKLLTLCEMGSVEYMVDDNNDIALTQGSRRTPELTFFPSLETLWLNKLPKLKGWWRDDILQSMECGGQHAIPSFPRLHTLSITLCPNMTSFPRCPHSHLKNVWLCRVDGLKFCKSIEAASGSKQTCVGESSSSSSSSKAVVSSNISSSSTHIDNNNQSSGFNLDKVTIDDIGVVNSFFGEALRVNTLDLCLSKIERLSDARIDEHLLNHLQYLRIRSCEKLEMEEEGDGMMPWKALHSLTRLYLCELPKMVNLPKGFQYLSSLHIESCDNLEALPEWLDSLTSLQILSLYFCPKLKSLPEAIRRLPSLTQLHIVRCGDILIRRCTEPDGEDCPKIRHIPNKYIAD